MAARELRYKWFEQLRNDLGAAGVCVAHHRNDAVETVLLNLVRGTGLRGLCGIQPRNGYILRPLLCVSREEIETFLTGRGQEYVTDSTNLEADVQRNKVRLQVLPLLKTLNPAVVENIQRTAENLMGAQATLDAVLLHNNIHNVLNLSVYNDCASREYVAYEWAKEFGFNGSQIRQILEAETGKIITSSSGCDILRDRDQLLVEPSLKPMKPLRIPEEGAYVFNENSRFGVKRQPVFISKTADVATVDAAKVVFPLTVRRVEEGDRMIPYGMKGRKLLSDLMTDRKMTVFEKRRQLVVVDAQGVILWLVGLRVDARVAVGNATSEVLVLRFDANEA
jgi:tRNA(Ile)-lysidine synthase